MSAANQVQTELKDGVLTITFDHPKVNAFTMDMIASTQAIFKDAERNDEIRCVLLTGKGKYFSTGHDLNDLWGATLYLDVDHSGTVTPGDLALDLDRQYASDDGALTFSNLSQILHAGSVNDLLIVYDLNGTASNGDTFALNWLENSHIEVIGASSENSMRARTDSTMP